MTYMIILSLTLVISSLALMPVPQSYEQGDTQVHVNQKCALRYLQNGGEWPAHIIELLKEYHGVMMAGKECNFDDSIKAMGLLEKTEGMLRVSMDLMSLDRVYSVNSTSEEAYELNIDVDLNVKIVASNHWGLARALDTLHQLLDGVLNLPLSIVDEPAFVHRGVMVDSARHYLSVRTLERTINALMLNKMNVLHWHITDDESFPLLLTKYSQITETSKFSDAWIFTKSDVQHLIEYAMARGVMIVPEIDTPGHTWSWGKSPDLADITLTCGSKIPQYGQLDPTMDKTYEVLTSVLQDLSDMFYNVPFVHFGGDEVVKSCYDKRPAIKEFMIAHNIADYEALEVYYRQRQKQIWRDVIKSPLKVAYWYNKEVNLPAEDDDIIHWWGLTSELVDIKTKTNKIVLSDYNTLYIDTGVGNAFGNSYQTYHTWKDIYLWNPYPADIQGTVIGAEACLWGETNNESTHFMKMFIRTSVLGDRLWNPKMKDTEIYSDFVKRLTEMEDRLLNQGYGVAPVTSDYCKRHTDVCFPPLTMDIDMNNDIKQDI